MNIHHDTNTDDDDGKYASSLDTAATVHEGATEKDLEAGFERVATHLGYAEVIKTRAYRDVCQRTLLYFRTDRKAREVILLALRRFVRELAAEHEEDLQAALRDADGPTKARVKAVVDEALRPKTAKRARPFTWTWADPRYWGFDELLDVPDREGRELLRRLTLSRLACILYIQDQGLELADTGAVEWAAMIERLRRRAPYRNSRTRRRALR